MKGYIYIKCIKSFVNGYAIIFILEFILLSIWSAAVFISAYLNNLTVFKIGMLCFPILYLPALLFFKLDKD